MTADRPVGGYTGSTPADQVPPPVDELGAANRRTFTLADKSAAIDRRGWTTQQWVDDARRIVDDVDGSAVCLLNSHVMALLRAAAAAEEPLVDLEYVQRLTAARDRARDCAVALEQEQADLQRRIDAALALIDDAERNAVTASLTFTKPMVSTHAVRLALLVAPARPDGDR